MLNDLPEQMKEYLQFCAFKSKVKDNSLDLSCCGWFYPTQLLPLGVFIKENKGLKVILPKSKSVSMYLSTIKENQVSEDKSYLPIIQLPSKEKLVNESLAKFYKLNNFSRECGGEAAFKYIVGELVDNVYQHSCFRNAFVMAQSDPKKGFIELCFCDDGITIPGSLKKAGMIFGEEEQAIVEAINGLSAKNDKERGYGLWSNLNLVLNGLNGEFLVISGNGAVFINKLGQKLFKLQTPNSFNGTLISIRVKNQSKEVNLYDFVEPHND